MRMRTALVRTIAADRQVIANVAATTVMVVDAAAVA